MKKYLVFGLLLVPSMALAQFGEVDTFLNNVVGFINGTLIPIILALAFLVFIWGAVKFFFFTDDGAGKEAGKNLMLWGIIGFVVIVSIWGIVRLLATGLDLNDETLENVPDAPVNN